MKTLTTVLYREESDEEIAVDADYEFHPAREAVWDYYGGEPPECEHAMVESVFRAGTREQVDLTEEEYRELDELALQTERADR
jgi:hypothetical protein